ncbi:MAG: HD domain-containing protein [Bacteroidales bacterium]|nr:HD domain-containing protein [Bacteroidales bacterium]
MVDSELKQYIEATILPQHNQFDKAHNVSHIRTVMARAMELGTQLGADPNMVYTAAAYHDTGIAYGRDEHHLHSGRIVRSDNALCQWFSKSQIETIAQAVEDHRASSKREPRSLLGKIVAEADRDIVPEKIVRRTIEYGLNHYPELDREEQWQRALSHLQEKYAEGGYMRLLIESSRNAAQLCELRRLIADQSRLRTLFDAILAESNL